MTNLTKLEFAALDIMGKNYLSWILDAEINLDAIGLGDTIKEGNESSNQDKAKAMIFLQHHLHEGLKTKYSQLKLCGENITDEDLLEKTFSPFHASNVLLQQQCREKGFQKYFELISCLLVAEQNNELLMKNHEALNVTISNNQGHGRRHGHGRGHGHRNGHGHQKWNNDEEKKEKGKSGQHKNLKNTEIFCYRRGMKGHWSRSCRMPKHLVELYQASLKEKETNTNANSAYQNENREANIAYQDDNFDHGPVDITHLDVAGFFKNLEGRIDQLIGGGNVQNY
ncbi:hypothetical protein Pint_26071 [Pistacia integerrima]|uniref:Uncharacterized protein n=1 Tax=Pistacia integerrima TaxID=434235 RepID=A0ACC0YGZ5_9ROSI|nr:hypothetical protein Pint_26071 [Pistacia integerrima]